MRRRAAAAKPEDAPEAAPAPADEPPPKEWHEFLSVRVVLVLSALFGVMHLSPRFMRVHGADD